MTTDQNISLYDSVIAIIREYGTVERPVTGREIAKYLEHDNSASISPTLTAIVRTKKHIHRLKAKHGNITTFGYWFNPKTTNLEYQGRRTKIYQIPNLPPKEELKPPPELLDSLRIGPIAKPEPFKVIDPEIRGIKILIMTQRGPLEMSISQAREAYSQLKELFE